MQLRSENSGQDPPLRQRQQKTTTSVTSRVIPGLPGTDRSFATRALSEEPVQACAEAGQRAGSSRESDGLTFLAQCF